jgi:DNA-3-methyladenine glycosylase I
LCFCRSTIISVRLVVKFLLFLFSAPLREKQIFYSEHFMTAEEKTGRCQWADLSKPDYVSYHDDEWGVPVHDDRKIYEFLTLESAQAGLSWYTILRKRENYRIAFENFDPVRIAEFSDKEVNKLLANPGIVRNRAKISAAINNAQRFLEVQNEFGSFDAYIWRFVDGRPIVNEINKKEDLQARTEISDKLSKDLKNRGFKFLGSTTLYAHMQATGMVNDHFIECFRRDPIIKMYDQRPAFLNNKSNANG